MALNLLIRDRLQRGLEGKPFPNLKMFFRLNGLHAQIAVEVEVVLGGSGRMIVYWCEMY